MRQCLHRTRRGFAIKDLCFGLAALAIAAALVITAAPTARKRAQFAAAQNQLRWIAGVTSSYAADFEDRLWGLSWVPGDLPHTNPMLPPRAFTSMDATAIQAIDILHRRAGRTDMRSPPSWYAPSLYSHLPLLDYLERDGPDLSFVSPGDEHRLNWTKDPRQLHDTGFWTPFQEPASLDNKRWPYSASFQAPAALMTRPASGASAVQSGGTHRSYTVPSGTTISAAAISDITYPAQKVLLHESATWYTGGPVRLYAHPSAQVNVLAADGAAQMLATAQGNAGWQPANPTSRVPTRFEYRPAAWEGPPPAPTEVLHIAHYRFTRGGPAGRDFGGPRSIPDSDRRPSRSGHPSAGYAEGMADADSAGQHAPQPPQLSIAALDDDADFREFIASALEQEGHEARVVATPAELVRACEERTPDIILLDIKMGRHSGEAVLADIKSRWPRQCVIVITGYPTMDSMREIFKRDAFDYLAKPFSIEDLRQSIAQAAEAFDLGRRPQDRLRAELGRQIRLARAQKDWTLKELSEASQVSVSQLSSIERGAHLPSVESLLAIALALDENPSEWLAAAGF